MDFFSKVPVLRKFVSRKWRDELDKNKWFSLVLGRKTVESMGRSLCPAVVLDRPIIYVVADLFYTYAGKRRKFQLGKTITLHIDIPFS